MHVLQLLDDRFGGPARRYVILTLAGTLALDSADKGAVGATAPLLDDRFGIGNTEVGLLVATSSIVGAVATIPVGMLTDRVNRTRLLAVSIVAWAVAMLASGAAPSFSWLLVSRLALGAVTATAGPTIASLIGDLFPRSERGRIYGYVLAGELVGAGFGLVASGVVAGLLSWRWAFWILAVPALLLARAVARMPEPARGGASCLRPGTQRLWSAEAAGERPDGAATGRTDGAAPDEAGHENGTAQEGEGAGEDDLAERVIADAGVEPTPGAVLSGDPSRLSLWRAVAHVLRVRTNLVLILASSLGYYFFTGLRTFGLTFLREHFGLAQTAASSLVLVIGVGALAGVLLGGRIGDALLRHRRLSGRILAALGAYALAVVAFVPGLLTTVLWLGVLLITVAAAGLGAANPPLDAARLDIMPSGLWGRAEAVRTVLRNIADASAPLVFGWSADRLGGRTGSGLQETFLIMLAPLLLGCLILLHGRATYPGDVAAAASSEGSRAAERGDAG